MRVRWRTCHSASESWSLAHRSPVDRANDDGVRSVAVGFLDSAEDARLRVGNERHAAVIHLPVAARKAVFNTFSAERSRQLVLVGMQNIDAKAAGAEHRMMQTG
jgi:hypothetical protein